VHPVTFRNPFERTSQPPHIVAVIPARYQSTRFPGKPLADIAGRSMIEHVYRRAASAPGIEAVVVATDDARVALTVERFGGIVRMTRSIHRTGTDRIAEVMADLECDIVVNVQGDLPAIEPEMIAQVLEPLESDPTVHVSTLRRQITDAADYSNPNVVKVVVDRHGHAIYFSRSPIPFVRRGEPAKAGPHDKIPGPHDDLPYVGAGLSRPFFKHIGLYAYRRAFLLDLTLLPPTPLEIAESLEQLRVLEYGHRIATVETHYESIEVDTPEDIERVRRMMTVETRA
jgi:3-deoxy-manno-octulosonate cytidylyltransferase (CMP-KDO synthetase)